MSESLPIGACVSDPAVRRLAQASIATGARGKPVRLIFTGLCALAGLTFLPPTVVAAFVAVALAYEQIIGPLLRRWLVERAPAATTRTGMEVRIALTAGIIGSAHYTWIAIPAWATGQIEGIALALVWTMGAVIHTMAYRSDSPILLVGSLVMPLVYILAAPLFSPGGYDGSDLLVILFWFYLFAAAGVFAHQRNALLARAEAAHEAGQVARDESEAKGRFLAAMSHELRTPLNAIIGYAQLAREDMTQGQTPDPQDMIRIERQANHLLGLITEILDFSKLDAGQMALHPVPCDPHTILVQVEEALRPVARAKGIAFKVDALTPLPRLQLDSKRLAQGVMNLASNAVKFTSAGSVCVEALVLPGPIGPILRFAVSDTGIGIEAADLDRLFQPFSQLDNSATRQHEGTGLGLVITRGFARQMGGDVSVTSTPGRGSTFTLDVAAIPALDAAPEACAA